MKQILDTRTTPPGGWVYVEPSTGTEFRDLSYQAVMARASAHRQAMNLPTGGEWVAEAQEIMIGLNTRIAWKDTEKPERHFNSDDLVRFVTTMQELSGHNLVSEEEQSRRAAICATCPKNGVIPCKFCGWLSKQITQFIGGRNIPHKEQIFRRSCLACGCDLSAKTAVPMNVLNTVDEKLGYVPDYAEGCWMREK